MVVPGIIGGALLFLSSKFISSKDCTTATVGEGGAPSLTGGGVEGGGDSSNSKLRLARGAGC